MPTIGDKKETGKRLTILGYGAAMSGKTRFILSLRKIYKGPCYIFNYDIEDNLLPLFSDPTSHDIEYDQYDNDKGYDNLVKKIVELKRGCKYDLIVLENINRLYKNTMKKVLTLGNRTDEDGARIQDWGNTNNKVYERIKEIITLVGPRCVYVTTHQHLEKDETSGKMVGQILIPSKQLPDEIPPMFNLNLRFFTTTNPTQGPEYWVQCAGDNTWGAGDKTGSLAFKEKPDFVQMATKMGKRFIEDPKPAAASDSTTIAATN